MWSQQEMATEYDKIWADMGRPSFVDQSEKARSNNPGLMHLRSKIKVPERYAQSAQAYDDFDAAEAAADWAELEKAIDDEIEWTVHMDDEMSSVDLSGDEKEPLSETEDMSEWILSDSEWNPADHSEQSEEEGWISESAQVDM